MEFMMLLTLVMWCHIYHCENKPWLLNTLSFYHLEDIHHTLTLAAVNGGSYGTEHSWPADSVTEGGVAKKSYNHSSM